MAKNRVGEMLSRVNRQAEVRLDSMSDHLPPVPQPKISFDEYLPRAMEIAQQDEKFAWELARSMRQAGLYGGGK